MSEGKIFRSRIAVGTDHAGNMIFKWELGHTEEELEENRKKPPQDMEKVFSPAKQLMGEL